MGNGYFPFDYMQKDEEIQQCGPDTDSMFVIAVLMLVNKLVGFCKGSKYHTVNYEFSLIYNIAIHRWNITKS